MSQENKHPDFYKDEYTEFLDILQESGVTNMWDSPAYLLKHTDITDEEIADKVFFYWKNNWKKLHEKESSKLG
jgi:hypothetical protein